MNGLGLRQETDSVSNLTTTFILTGVPDVDSDDEIVDSSCSEEG